MAIQRKMVMVMVVVVVIVVCDRTVHTRMRGPLRSHGISFAAKGMVFLRRVIIFCVCSNRGSEARHLSRCRHWAKW